MLSALEGLSTEILEMVVAYQELDDIGSLRLTSRVLEQKVSAGHFTTFFTRKSIDLTVDSLQELVRVTASGRPGCHLQHCTLTGVVWCTNKSLGEEIGIRNDNTLREKDEKQEEERQKKNGRNEREHSQLLKAAFSNLKQHSPKGTVASLCLRVIDNNPATQRYRSDRTCREIWDAAASLFSMTVDALQTSQLLVDDHLDVFGSIKKCSLCCDVFQACIQKFEPSLHVFRRLKSLTLSLSAPQKDPEPETETEDPPEEHTESESLQQDPESTWTQADAVLQRLLWLSRSMPRLERLDLHWCDVDRQILVSSAHEDYMDNASSPPARLKECTLRGTTTSKRGLLRFIDASRPAVLTLIWTHLGKDETYDDLFKYLLQPDCPVTAYHLDDICGSGVVHYPDIPGKSKFPYLNRPNLGPSTLTRLRGHAKNAVRYHFADTRALGSPARMKWRRALDENYGSH